MASPSLLFAALLHGAYAGYNFVTVGDWGGATLGSYHTDNAHAVAKQLGKSAADLSAQFVINTGDNFYYCGVKNLTDDQFKNDFEDVYTDKSLMVPWYGVLGNHDYAFNVESQLKYKSPNADRWQMPARYFSKRVQLAGSQYASFVFLDTNPCVAAYRANDPKGWDPCSGEFGNECAMPDGQCLFHEHVVAQDCGAQAAWLKKTLDSIDSNDWIIAVGHHPADEINVEDLTSLLLAGRVSLYLNGHTHAMIHYQMDENQQVDFVTSGAGCMVHTKDQDNEANLLGTDHSKQEIKYLHVSGFSTHSFSDDFSSLKTELVDASGNVLHSFVTKKRGSGPQPTPAPPGPQPTPSPPTPAPPSEGSCQSYGCGRFDRKHACQCNTYCKHHGDCCKDYDTTCRGADSCARLGCGHYSKEHTCQCNHYCKEHGDCCSDYDKVCHDVEEMEVV